ncbi:MAG: urease accessory protein UreE [Pseudoprimorskyibacter sp.]|nr:urease accessory protein UreE [Pseudoprimorskyibacter sp.]
MPTAHRYHSHAHGAPADKVTLTYEDRFLRRKVLTTDTGEDLLVDLAQTTSLEHGGVLITVDGDEVTVAAAPEPLLAIAAADLTRIAWHIGNRHTPCQIETNRLLIQRDHVMADLLARIGATVSDVIEPFTPEGGAYGHGRTHGHDHSHPHAHDNTHVHSH